MELQHFICILLPLYPPYKYFKSIIHYGSLMDAYRWVPAESLRAEYTQDLLLNLKCVSQTLCCSYSNLTCKDIWITIKIVERVKILIGLTFVSHFLISTLEPQAPVHHWPFTQRAELWDYSDVSQKQRWMRGKEVRERDVVERQRLISTSAPRNHVLFTKLFFQEVSTV